MSTTQTEEQKQIMREWLAALRDPRAVQTKGVLGWSDGSRCCLGVLCDLAAKHGVIPEGAAAKSPGLPAKMLYVDSKSDVIRFQDSIVSERVREWAGLPMRHGFFVDGHTLAYWNDHGKSFAEIADMIERYVFVGPPSPAEEVAGVIPPVSDPEGTY